MSMRLSALWPMVEHGHKVLVQGRGMPTYIRLESHVQNVVAEHLLLPRLARRTRAQLLFQIIRLMKLHTQYAEQHGSQAQKLHSILRITINGSG